MKKPTSVDEYINSFPKEVQEVLETLRTTIKEVIPNAEEKISYGIPVVMQKGKYIIYYSAWKKHTSLYPYTADMVEKFKESSDYVTSGKGTIQFPLDRPLPLPLIRKITKYKLEQATKNPS